MYVLIIACASHKENINVLVLLDTCNKNSHLRRPNQGRNSFKIPNSDEKLSRGNGAYLSAFED